MLAAQINRGRHSQLCQPYLEGVVRVQLSQYRAQMFNAGLQTRGITVVEVALAWLPGAATVN